MRLFMSENYTTTTTTVDISDSLDDIMNLVNENDITTNQFVSEFARLVNILPNVKGYFYNYIKETNIIKAIADNFFETLGVGDQGYYLNKHEIIDYDDDNRAYIKQDVLDQKVSEICRTASKTVRNQERTILTNDLIQKFIDPENAMVTEVMYPFDDSDFFIICDFNNTSMPMMTMSYEFCRCLQRTHNNEWYTKLLDLDERLEQAATNKEKQKIKNEMNKCQSLIKAQAGLFAAMSTILYSFNIYVCDTGTDVVISDFDRLKNMLLLRSNKEFDTNLGFCEFSVWKEEFEKISQNPQLYDNKFLTAEKIKGKRETSVLYPEVYPNITVHALNYEGLYNYTREIIKNKVVEFENEPEKISKKLSSEINEVDNSRDLSYNFDKISNIIIDGFRKKEFQLKHYEDELNRAKEMMLRSYWKSLDKTSDKLTKKFKVNEVKMVK